MVTLRKVTTAHLAPSIGAELLVHVRRRSPVEARSNKVPPTAQAFPSDNFQGHRTRGSPAGILHTVPTRCDDVNSTAHWERTIGVVLWQHPYRRSQPVTFGHPSSNLDSAVPEFMGLSVPCATISTIEWSEKLTQWLPRLLC